MRKPKRNTQQAWETRNEKSQQRNYWLTGWETVGRNLSIRWLIGLVINLIFVPNISNEKSSMLGRFDDTVCVNIKSSYLFVHDVDLKLARSS